MSDIIDSYHRRINYTRISVTDRCNLRCIYCTARWVPGLSHDEILRYEEIYRVVQALAELGVKKIRLTGGEPLVRLNLSRLVAMIVQVDGVDEVSLTTNGTLLDRYADELKSAGLRRVNVSLDSFRPGRFQRITGSNRIDDVLRGIEAAKRAQLDPVKINMVVLKGINDDEIPDFARKSISDGWHVRFIEHMPFTSSDGENDRLMAISEVMAVIQETLGTLNPCWPVPGNGPAKYYQLPGAKGTIGFIAPVTECFCANCNRFRLTADGRLRPCLLEDDEVDIKGPLRRGASIEELGQLIHEAAALKRAKHRLGEKPASLNRQMRQIGG
jgi:cyclic pyranopterin phosphate synthase